MSQIQTKGEKDFNKGIAALNASLMAVLGLIVVFFLHSMLVGIVCGLYAYKTKMVPTYYKKSGAWGYAGLIWLWAIFGLPYFFYDVLKNKAIKEGCNIDTPKGVLFWLCTCFWILLAFLMMFLVIYASILENQ